MKFTTASIIASLAVAVAALPGDATYPVCIKETYACKWYADSYFAYGDHPENQCCTGYSCSATSEHPEGTCVKDDDSAEPTYPAHGETCHRKHRRDWRGDCGTSMYCAIDWTAYPDGKTGTCQDRPADWPTSGTDYEAYANTDYNSADYKDTFGDNGDGASCHITWNSGPDGDCSSGYTCKCLGTSMTGTCVARPDCSGSDNGNNSNDYPVYDNSNDNGNDSGNDYPVYDHGNDSGNDNNDYPVYDHGNDSGNDNNDYPVYDHSNNNDSGDNNGQCSASGATCSCDSECCSGTCSGLGARSGGATLGSMSGCCK